MKPGWTGMLTGRAFWHDGDSGFSTGDYCAVYKSRIDMVRYRLGQLLSTQLD
jgi:hypothetical protein